jgi:hypothetical protein
LSFSTGGNLSAKEKDSKKKEELKSFTVGSVKPSAPKGKKAPKSEKLEVSEKEFPILAGLIREQNAKAFQDEMIRILAAVEENAKSGDSKDKDASGRVQKAYGMAIAILENAKVTR